LRVVDDVAHLPQAGRDSIAVQRNHHQQLLHLLPK
jgi:hypothetical protein